MKTTLLPVPQSESLPLHGGLTRVTFVVGCLLLLNSMLPANAGSEPQPPGSHSFGKSLAQWQATWLEWDQGALSPPTDAYGNALVNRVVLLPIPVAAGDGTPASRDVTLQTGEPFVVPLVLVVGGTGSPMVSPTDFENISLTLTLDGATILDSSGAFRYYTQTEFNPPLSPSVAWVQGLSIAHTPLRPGNHVLKLDEKLTLPEYGSTLEYHNTLNITVVPGR